SRDRFGAFPRALVMIAAGVGAGRSGDPMARARAWRGVSAAHAGTAIRVAWLAWAAWVALHYFTLPTDRFVAFDGPYPFRAAFDALARDLRAAAGAAAIVFAAWGIGSLVAAPPFRRSLPGR